MRDEFPGYYSLVDEAFDELWDSAVVVLDASALLSLYRYSVATSAGFLSALEYKSDQLWIPYQVGLEFHRNRDSVILSQREALTKVGDSIESAYASIENALRTHKRHQTLEIDELSDVVRKNRKRLRKLLKQQRARHQDLVETARTNDSTTDAISRLYAGRVGPPWANERLDKLYTEGAKRYEKNLPPGYEDKKKPGSEAYGDLVIWRQILEHAANESSGVIFVTDDSKEDWWWIVTGERRGARPELVAEFKSQVGKNVKFLSSQDFLTIARERGDLQVTDESVDEVEEVAQRGVLAAMDSVERTFNASERETIRRALDALGQGSSSHLYRAIGSPLTPYLDGLRGVNTEYPGGRAVSDELQNALAHMPSPVASWAMSDALQNAISHLQTESPHWSARISPAAWEAARIAAAVSPYRSKYDSSPAEDDSDQTDDAVNTRYREPVDRTPQDGSKPQH